MQLGSNLAVPVEHPEALVVAIHNRWQHSKQPEVSMPNSSNSTMRGQPPEANPEDTKGIPMGEDIRDSKVDNLVSNKAARARTKTNECTLDVRTRVECSTHPMTTFLPLPIP